MGVWEGFFCYYHTWRNWRKTQITMRISSPSYAECRHANYAGTFARNSSALRKAGWIAIEPVLNFSSKKSVHGKYIPAISWGWQTSERIIRVM